MWGMFCLVLQMEIPTTTCVAVVCSWLHALYKLVISPPTWSRAVNCTSCLPPCPWPQSPPLWRARSTDRSVNACCRNWRNGPSSVAHLSFQNLHVGHLVFFCTLISIWVTTQPCESCEQPEPEVTRCELFLKSWGHCWPTVIDSRTQNPGVFLVRAKPFYEVSAVIFFFFVTLWKKCGNPPPPLFLSHALTNISDPSVVTVSYSSSTLTHAVFTHVPNHPHIITRR